MKFKVDENLPGQPDEIIFHPRRNDRMVLVAL